MSIANNVPNVMITLVGLAFAVIHPPPQVLGASWWDQVRPHPTYADTFAVTTYRFQLCSNLVK